MSSAKLYLQSSVVDRLSRPVTSLDGTQASSGADDSMLRAFDNSFLGAEHNVIDAATFIGSLQPNNGASRASSSPHLTGHKPAQVPPEAVKPALNKEELRQRHEKFNNFYARQQMLITRKEKSLKDVRTNDRNSDSASYSHAC
jgi:hypothetical protein